MKGLEAKDKNVRFRSVSTVAELVSHLGELEYVPYPVPRVPSPDFCSEDLYEQLRLALLERRRDREAFVRSQSILALAKLMDTDPDEDAEEDSEESIIACILNSLCTDDSP